MRKTCLVSIVGVLIAVTGILIILGTFSFSSLNTCNSELEELYQSRNEVYFNWQKDYGDITYYQVLATQYLLMAHVLDSDLPPEDSTYINEFDDFRFKRKEKWDPISERDNLIKGISSKVKDKVEECGRFSNQSKLYSNLTLFTYIIIFFLSILILDKSKK